MAREDFVQHRALHREWDLTGTILDVHLDVRPQTAKFLPDDWDEERATWVNLGTLQLYSPERERESG